MREIEVKAKVADKTKVIDNLTRLGIKLSPPKTQHDIVYSRPGAKDNDPGENWLRIRIQDETKIFFTLKRSVTGEMDSIEHEVIVDNANELKSIINYLGYELFSDLTKIRQTGHFGDLEICFDEVPELGTFIEVEKLCPEDTDINAVTTELWEVLAKLNVTKADEETSGYDVLMRRLKGVS